MLEAMFFCQMFDMIHSIHSDREPGRACLVHMVNKQDTANLTANFHALFWLIKDL